MDIDLTTEFAGIEFPNPLILASGPIGWCGKSLKKAAEAGAGGVVTKTMMLEEARYPRPRYAITKLGIQNIETFSEIGAEKWAKKEIKIAKEARVPIIGSIIGGREIEGWIKLAKLLENAGIDMIELNLSCPHPLPEKKHLGMILGQDPNAVMEIVKSVKEEVSVPVMTKLTIKVLDIAEIAKTAEKAGADAISAINTVPESLMGIDIETGKPYLPCLGGYSGPGIKPIALGAVVKIAKAVNIPISGIGGVMSWSDAIEMIMAGATTVQLCTVVMLKGVGIFKEMLQGIKEFMHRKGYGSIKSLRGVALKYIVSLSEVELEPPIELEVNENLCKGCGLCCKICPYEAVSLSSSKGSGRTTAIIHPDKCEVCGLCVQLCPTQAIKYIEKR
jgi:dihydropyrimidine dehydrogenase (NAD+) subunit PreA